MAKKIQAPADLPTYDKMMWPAIVALRELGGSASTEELIDKIVRAMNISEETQTFRRPEKSRDELLLRSDWTKWYLRKAQIIDYQNSLWILLPPGRSITEFEVKELPAKVRKLTSKAPYKDDEAAEPDEEQPPVEPKVDFVEQNNWRGELLEVLRNMDPTAFERLTMRLLRASGFEQVEVTQRSNDGGIDGKGVLRVNLLSFYILFQCKRYKASNPIHRPDIQAFRGAIHGKTEKGLFITTSRFSSGAKEEAIRGGGLSIELIDGESLCELLKKLQLGTKTEIIQHENVTIDHDFFSQI